MRRRTSPAPLGDEPFRPEGSNGTAKRDARIPTATSLRLLPRSATSAARRCFSSSGIRTSTSFLLALKCYQDISGTPKLPADVDDPLDHRQPGCDGEEVDGPGQHAPRGEKQAGDDHRHPLCPAPDPDVALEVERLRLGPRVADEERAGHGREGGGERDLVSVSREDERDRSEHDCLADAIRGRVEEGAERGAAPALAGERAVEHVQQRPGPEQERPRPEPEDLVPVLEVDGDGGERANGKPERRQRIRGDSGPG